MKVITADTDIDQHVGGVTTIAMGAAPQSLATGPFYLTDARRGGGASEYRIAPAAGSCAQGLLLPDADTGSGVRLLIGADQQLCALNTSQFSAVNFFWLPDDNYISPLTAITSPH